jgi:hypothetical protein
MSGMNSHTYKDVKHLSRDALPALRDLIHFFENQHDPGLTVFIARLSKFYIKTTKFLPETTEEMKLIPQHHYKTPEDLSSAKKTVDYFLYILLKNQRWQHVHGIDTVDWRSAISAWIEYYKQKFLARPEYTVHRPNPQMFDSDEANESVSGESDSSESDFDDSAILAKRKRYGFTLPMSMSGMS